MSLSIDSTDFALRDTPVILSRSGPTSGSAEVRLDASNDDVTLEIGDTVILRLDPSSPRLENPIPIAMLTNQIEEQGQFLRDTATVTILDNDCKLTTTKHRELLCKKTVINAKHVALCS